MGHILKGQVRYTLAVEDVIQQGEIPTDLQGISALTFTSGVSASFDENIDADSTVYTVAAEKPDGTTTGITYGISGTDANDFTINANTGVITIDASPNFEADPSYSIIVTANHANFDAVTREVTLAVNNLDDTAPVIQSNAMYSGTHLIGSTTPIGTVLHTAVATDTGDGTNGNVTYQVTSQYDNAFAIDANTGVLTLASQPGSGGSWSASYSQNTCTITAVDDAGNVSSAVTIDFRGVSGIVIQGGTISAVAESLGTYPFHILNLTTGTRSNTDFFIVSDPSGLFNIVESGASAGTGGGLFLSTAGSLDYETATSHTITVQAVDKQYPLKKSAVTTITIPVTDVQPVITSGGSVTSIVENSGANQTIYTATATDADPQGGTITFSLAAGSDSAISINSTTGVVTLADNPDYETQTSYSFTVVATNAQNDSASQALTLSITDVFEGLSANGTLGFFTPVGGVYYKGFDASTTSNSPWQHPGTLTPTSNSNFYNGTAVKAVQYGYNQYSSASGTEFVLALAGDTRSQPGFKLVVTDKNNVSRTFRSTDSNLISESYNSFGGETSYTFDVVDTDAQAVAFYKSFTGITSMVVGEKYNIQVIPYAAHSSGSPGTGNNPSSDRGQAVLSIGGNSYNNSFYGTIVTANSNITNSTNITNTQDIQFSAGGTADIAAGDANGTGDSFSITLEEL